MRVCVRVCVCVYVCVCVCVYHVGVHNICIVHCEVYMQKGVF